VSIPTPLLTVPTVFKTGPEAALDNAPRILAGAGEHDSHGISATISLAGSPSNLTGSHPRYILVARENFEISTSGV